MSEEDFSEEVEESTSKARANHLPPVEILFAHLDRVDTMKQKVVDPVLVEKSKAAPLKQQATFAANTMAS